MLHILINPGSSSGSGINKWTEIEKLFQKYGAQYTVHQSSPSRSIEDICGELTGDGRDCTLVILGGDGSMNWAVNGIRDFARTKIGFIPIGSGNDLALDIDLPKDIEELVRRISKEEVVRRCDIGRVTYHNRCDELDPFSHRPVKDPPKDLPPYRLFNISSGIGFDAACCQSAEVSRFKKVLNRIHLGKLIYLAAAIKLILTAPMEPATITFTDADGTVRTREFRHLLFAVCMNHRYEGGGFKFCPDASVEDGIMDVCMAGDLNRLNFFRIFPTAYDGGHLAYDGVEADRSVSVDIRTSLPLWVHTDGEVACRSSAVSFDILPEKLQMIV